MKSVTSTKEKIIMNETKEFNTTQEKDGDDWMKLFVNLFENWAINTTAIPKKYEGEWHVRYTWEAKKISQPEQGTLLKSEWRGFATHREMMKNMIQVIY